MRTSSPRAMRCAIFLLLTIVGALVLATPAALAADGDRAGTVRFVTQSETLEKARSSETFAHLQKVAAELRQLAEARAKGTQAPAMVTDGEKVFFAQGMTGLRLGVSQLHTMFVRLDGDQPVAACIEPGHEKALSVPAQGAPAVEVQ